MVLFIGRDHHQNPVGTVAPFFHFDSPIDGTFTNRNTGPLDILMFKAAFGQAIFEDITVNALEQLFGILKLGHIARITKIGDLHALDAGKSQFMQIEDLGPGRNELFFMLKAVAYGYITNIDFFRHSFKDIKKIVV